MCVHVCVRTCVFVYSCVCVHLGVHMLRVGVLLSLSYILEAESLTESRTRFEANRPQ